MTSALDSLAKERRKEIVKVGTVAYKSGAQPSATDDGAPLDVRSMPRHKQRQLARAMGIPGTKAMKKNPAKAQRRLERRSQEVERALMGDAALAVAAERTDHPIRSRLRRG